MDYEEKIPNARFTRHVECFWCVRAMKEDRSSQIEILLPTCTFNIIFVNEPCFVKVNQDRWVCLLPGANFLGQTNSLLSVRMKASTSIIGIRFKPFAFANIIKKPLVELNDQIVPINAVFDLRPSIQGLIDRIILKSTSTVDVEVLNQFLSELLDTSSPLDEGLRAQLNFIMDRHGRAKISEVFKEFKVSGVTLRKHFVNKVGLTPKKVSQIWRMNGVLFLKESQPHLNLTQICLQAGFFDQAHFIKDFKQLFGSSPKTFFKSKNDLIKVATVNISKRFSKQYDPKGVSAAS